MLMMERRRFLLLAFLGASAALTGGCRDREGSPRELTVEELAGMLEGGSVAVFDANSDKVRQEYGVIPGAKLLQSTGDYDPANVLPDDKSTTCVFYCSSTWCSAARTAAVRAKAAGYQDVAVLPEGIKGWTSAGQPTTKL
jgi:rhodanese-related sulfurtransferase